MSHDALALGRPSPLRKFWWVPGERTRSLIFVEEYDRGWRISAGGSVIRMIIE